MADKGWRLRPAAEADLEAIWRRGAADWGVRQSDRYIDALFAVLDVLADFPELAREKREFTPPVRIHPTREHLVVYLRDGQGIDVIRILHGHSNLMALLDEG
jgi:toxin ParE1/3/4